MASHIDEKELLERGVVQILPDKASLQKRLAQGKIRLYLGIDPTGAQLHLGHAVALRKLQQFALAGHEVILLIGNGTVKIGDPTGRDSSRPMLTDEEIETNFVNWQKQASKILDFSLIKVKKNGDWLDKLAFSDIVKLLAKTTVQQLLERDIFQERLKKNLPIFGHEIIYPLLQGYDSVAMDVDLEIGGTDQTFNMLMGRNLQKIYHQKEKWVLTVPLIRGLDGRKMSKSFANYIALTEEPRQMYALVMSASDEVMWEYLENLTSVSTAEITQMKKQVSAGENPKIFKQRLAREIVTWLHSSKQALAAQEYWQKTVAEKQLPENLPMVVVSDFSLPLFDLAKAACPQESNSALRRLIDQGAVELLDNQVLTRSEERRVGKECRSRWSPYH